ncbi:10896_t:CDS:2 [Diversispora eburnea]|uniref:10896_t:CDS:1 n=1 Tax=Diversispora eburnea TaxID=1213867 RepID=A0A9N9BWT8_9GLOM|nr:10896_t:CDS:2 [Diversispora eburnea]
MNAFIIYRNEYQYLHPNNNSCKDASKLAAERWSKEPEDVKSYYKEIAKQHLARNQSQNPLEIAYSIHQNVAQNSSVTT